MTDWNRTLQADYDLSPALVDVNPQLAWNSLVELSLWQDLFGATLDGHWTLGEGFRGLGEDAGGTYSESAGEYHFVVAAAGGYESKAIRSPAVFNNIDCEVDCTNFAHGGAAGASVWGEMVIFKDSNNYVAISREKNPGSADRITFVERIGGGSATLLAQAATAAAAFNFRLIRSSDTFEALYDVGGGWVSMGTTTAAIGSDCSLYLNVLASDARTITIDFDNLEITGSSYYWDGSPECYVIDSASGSVEYVVDLGANNRFQGSGFAATVSEPSGTSVKFKMGYGIATDRASATYDSTWRTTSELNNKVAAGDFDGYRYLFLIPQFNSDGTARSTLTDITISGAAVTHRANARHADALRLFSGAAEIKHLAWAGTIPGVVILAAAALNGPGMGTIRSSGGAGTGLSWKAPGSSSFGGAIPCSVDGYYLLEDGDDPDKYLAIQVYATYLVPDPIDARVYLQDVYENGVSNDDITAAEAAAGHIESHEIVMANDSDIILSDLRVWLDSTDATYVIEISDDDATWVNPTTEAAALSFGDLVPDVDKTLYVRRTVAASVASNAGYLNHLHFAFNGL